MCLIRKLLLIGKCCISVIPGYLRVEGNKVRGRDQGKYGKIVCQEILKEENLVELWFIVGLLGLLEVTG